MNSQDITRALIDTTVARAMVEMDADPKRSVRKLCDLGRQFSRGRFQNQIFAMEAVEGASIGRETIRFGQDKSSFCCFSVSGVSERNQRNAHSGCDWMTAR